MKKVFMAITLCIVCAISCFGQVHVKKVNDTIVIPHTIRVKYDTCKFVKVFSHFDTIRNTSSKIKDIVYVEKSYYDDGLKKYHFLDKQVQCEDGYITDIPSTYSQKYANKPTDYKTEIEELKGRTIKSCIVNAVYKYEIKIDTCYKDSIYYTNEIKERTNLKILSIGDYWNPFGIYKIELKIGDDKGNITWFSFRADKISSEFRYLKLRKDDYITIDFYAELLRKTRLVNYIENGSYYPILESNFLTSKG